MEDKYKQFKTLKRESSFYRPYVYNGLQCESLVFYSKGKILYKSNSGFLEDETSKQDVTEIKVKNEFKRALKEDLNRKDNFYLKGRREYSFDDGQVFYINCDLENINIKYTDFEHKFNTETEEVLYKYAVITAKDLFKRYESYLDKDQKLQYKEIDTESIKVFKESKHIKNKLGLQVERIEKHLKKHTNKHNNPVLSSYDIEKLLRVVNITTKKEVE
jgi:hypothetical protein